MAISIKNLSALLLTAQAIKLHSGDSFKTPTISELLKGKKDFRQDAFDELLIRQDGFPHILLSDTFKLIDKIASEFPEYVKVESIGQSWQSRPLKVVTLDARKLFSAKQQDSDDLKPTNPETKQQPPPV